MTPLSNTHQVRWGGELDTTTTCQIRHLEPNVFNVDKAWALDMRQRQERPNPRQRCIFVWIYGGGKKSLMRRYYAGQPRPAGLQCDFSFQIIRRGNGFTCITRSPLRWSVNRAQPRGRNPLAPKYTDPTFKP